MEYLSQVWQKMGFSSNAVKTMLASWAPNTIKAYNSVLRKWQKFCEDNTIDNAKPQPQNLVNFLQEVADTGVGQSAISTHRAALTTFLSAAGNADILDTAEPFLAKFSKGLIREKPKDPKRAVIWDVEQALDWIRKCWPLQDLSPKTLTLRTVLLLALCSPKRASEIANLSLDKLVTSASTWEFRLLVTKNRGFGTPHGARFQKFRDEPALCPIENLEFYTNFTSALRSSPLLLVSYQKPHKPVGASTVSRWLKLALNEAGIEGYTGHSTRSAATSAAAARGLSTAQIVSAANWSVKGSTFQRFYHKDIEDSFQDTILRLRFLRTRLFWYIFL